MDNGFVLLLSGILGIISFIAILHLFGISSNVAKLLTTSHLILAELKKLNAPKP